MTLSSPSWRSLNHLKRSLNRSKKVTSRIARWLYLYRSIFYWLVWVHFFFGKKIQRVDILSHSKPCVYDPELTLRKRDPWILMGIISCTGRWNVSNSLHFERVVEPLMFRHIQMWVFPKIGVFTPQIIHFNRVFHDKQSILGADPYFWKHPCRFFKLFTEFFGTGGLFRFKTSFRIELKWFFQGINELVQFTQNGHVSGQIIATSHDLTSKGS